MPVSVAGPDIPEGALSGVFSVSATKKVYFSKGNLTCDISGATPEWKFYEHQYDCATDYDANLISLFTWGYDATKSIVPNGNEMNNVSRTSGELTQEEDWGCKIGDGKTWRTLTTAEWQYLINKNNDENIRKGKYKCGVEVCEKSNCLILAPDDFTGTIEVSYDAAAWATAEAAGLVCLPIAGARNGSSVLAVGGGGFYWSSSASGSDLANCMYFSKSSVIPDNNGSRGAGYSVRLVTDASAAPAPTPTTTGTAKATIGGSEVDVKWIQFWENGPKFAEYNVGVTDGKAESYGGYYCWGKAIDKDSSGSYKDGESALSGDDDTATKLWGSNWRMPTQAELNALLSSCDVEWMDGSTKKYKDTNIIGLLCTGKGAYASNSVFLPAAGFYDRGNVSSQGMTGYYWSSTPRGGNDASYLTFSSSIQIVAFCYYRNYGCSVRAVLAE